MSRHRLTGCVLGPSKKFANALYTSSYHRYQLRNMTYMTSAEVRRRFLQYFEKHDHELVNSSSLIPPGDDGSLLFTNAGMVPFKQVFLGKERRPYTRAASSQRCVRAGGKHNDLEQVGLTRRHHTLFEMLGNFSFGDYFKKDAIYYSWDFLTKDLGLPVERLHVTVLEKDYEARYLWQRIAELPDTKILSLDEKDNFWSMGETGPCGPCSEIFWDLGEHIIDPDERYLELWNLVFMQYSRDAYGSICSLPQPCVDTGMGLERIASVLQGVPSNYHTDIYANFMKDVAHILDDGRSMQYKSTRPLFIDILSQELDPSKPKFGDSEEIRTLRIVADHLKAAYAMLSDGIFPSNISRGYVLRRMIRRAIRHAQKCGVEGEFLCKVFPEELKRTPGFVQLQSIISNEEKAFAEMLCNGKRVLEKVFSKAKKERSFVISGKDSFRLYDTFGIPMDITQVLAEEQGFSVDTLEFERCLAAHKQKAQGFSAGHSGLNTISALSEKSFAEFTGFHQEFVGYRDLVVENTKVLGMWKNDVAKDGKAKKFNKLEYWVSINPTPFYAECGGQVGDRGTLRFRDLTQDTSTEMTVHVEDTKRFAQKVFAVLCSVPSDQVETFEYLVKQPTVQVFAQVDQKFRNGCAVHHSATHLLQSALKKVLGEHVTQAGSFVTSNRLRFDFSHFGALSLDEIAQIEKNVNGLALNSIEVEIKEMSRHEAEQSGAICNFGEKYDEVVRVVSIGGSKEFCGGTHVENSSSIFPFVILSESSVAAGIRRIEAIASIEGTKYLQTKDKALQDLAVQLETTAAKVPERVSKLQKQVKSTESFAQALIDILVDLPSNPLVSGKFLYSDQLNAQVHLIKLKNEKNSTEKSNNSSLLKLLRRRAEFLFLKSPKTTHFVLLGQNIVCRSNGKNGAHAGKMLQQAVKKFGGRGGGNAIFAQGSIPQDVSVQEFSKQTVGNME